VRSHTREIGPDARKRWLGTEQCAAQSSIGRRERGRRECSDSDSIIAWGDDHHRNSRVDGTQGDRDKVDTACRSDAHENSIADMDQARGRHCCVIDHNTQLLK
jgi:hypothetical protein